MDWLGGFVSLVEGYGVIDLDLVGVGVDIVGIVGLEYDIVLKIWL